MNKIFEKRNLLLLLVIFLSGSNTILAQQSNTNYFMRGVPQSYLLNPATQPRCNFFLGMPGLAPLEMTFEHSALSFSDIFMEGSNGETITPIDIDENADLSAFLNNFQDRNTIGIDQSLNVASLGFRAGETFVMLDIRQRTMLRFAYPGDLINLIFEGNENGDFFDLSSFSLNTTSLMEFGLGLSKEISSGLTVGVRGKLLFGLADLSTNVSEMSIQTNREEWIVTSKFEGNANLPFVNIPITDGDFEFDSLEIEENISTSSGIEAATGNFGLGLDLGAHYNLDDKVSLSASIIDLGYVRWKTNNYNISQDATFSFDGVDVPFIDSLEMGQALMDSLENEFNITGSKDPYTTFLTAKVYLGGQYHFTEKISVGVLSRSEIYKSKIRQQFTFSANFYPLKMLAASFSYTIKDNTYNNFGLGVSTKLGPLNLYMISDLVPVHLGEEVSTGLPIIPREARMFNLRFGLNLIFGCKKDPYKDVPMLYDIPAGAK